MRYVLALFCPWASLFTMGNVGQSILWLFLLLTLIDWIPATLWAFVAIAGHNGDKRTDPIVAAVSQTNAQPAAADPRSI
jgi:uncharacterized membrane protein YqaE (UPF0057 family)